jgi:hypothetical protein
MYYVFLAVTFVVAVAWFKVRKHRKQAGAASQ